MAREIPEVVRAVAGLTATVLDEARRLPGELTHLPVRLLGLAMQTSLRLQQQYSGLVARGDEVFTGLWGSAEPGMATFDEDLPMRPPMRPAPVTFTANRTSAFDLADEPPAATTEDAAAEERLTEALVEEALAEELGGETADLTVELTDEIADLSDTSELADVAGLADLAGDPTADPVADLAAELGTGLPADDLPADDLAPLADVLAFETLAAEGERISDAQVAELPADPPADVVTETVDELAGEVDAELAAELPESVPDEVADDLAADTVATVADAEVAAAADGAADDGAADRAATGADRGSPGSLPDDATVRDLGLVGTADATDLDLEIPDLALPELPGLDSGAGSEAAAGSGTAGAPSAAAAPAEEAPPAQAPVAEAPAEPVPGYDGFTIPALRGRLRSYPAETVAALLDHERATRARAPYVTLLQNRLEKLSADRG